MKRRGVFVLGLTLTAMLWLSPAQADIPQAEENPSGVPASELLLTNTADLAGLFLENYNYPIGSWVWTPLTFAPMTIVWADTSNLPAELAGITNTAPTSVEGMNAWPLWVTLWPESSSVTVLQPWSDVTVTEFSVPDGFPSWPVYEASLYPSCILSGINYTNWQTLVEEGHDQFAVPQVVTHAWLMDIGDRDAYWANLEADCEAQAALSSSTGGFTLLSEDEEIESVDPCSLTNLLQAFAVSSVVYTTNGLTLTFPSCQVFRYEILTADVLTSNTTWATRAYTSYLWGQPGVSATSWTDATATNVTERFYRVERINGSVIAAGANHSLALTSDHILYGWGGNDAGQISDGSTTERVLPTPILSNNCNGVTISNVTAVAAGNDFTVVVDADGAVWTAGAGVSGQLGNGAYTSRDTLAPISGVSNIVSVAAGGAHTLALRADGTVWAFGDNVNGGGSGGRGQLGAGNLGGAFHTNLPVRSLLPTGTVVVAIAAGDGFSLALDTTGLIWGFGGNEYGQIGPTPTPNQDVSTNLPVVIAGISNVIAIAAGDAHTIALTADKRAWTFGANYSGQLGDGTTTSRSTPAPVLSNAVAIAGGAGFSVAVTSNGAVYAWGDNFRGQLATNGPTELDTPTKVAGISNAVLVSAHPDGLHVLAVTVDQGTNRYFGWGDNEDGQIGNGTNGAGVVQYTPALETLCGQCIQLGTNGSFTAECTGTLTLYFNDGYCGDNATNAFTVTIPSVGTTSVPGNACGAQAAGVPGVAIGPVTNGVTYFYTATGFVNWDNGDPTDLSDANGNKPDGTPWGCAGSGDNVCGQACPFLRCVSLVGRIE